MKTKYVFPAIFTKEEDGKYSVSFPDLQGCYTCGDDLADAIFMAEDVLAFTICSMKKRGEEISEPSKDLKTADDSFVNYILCDILEYQKKKNNRAVKKTLSIPEYLNEAAVEADLNFSQILQEGIKSRLGLA